LVFLPPTLQSARVESSAKAKSTRDNDDDDSSGQGDEGEDGEWLLVAGLDGGQALEAAGLCELDVLVGVNGACLVGLSFYEVIIKFHVSMSSHHPLVFSSSLSPFVSFFFFYIVLFLNFNRSHASGSILNFCVCF